MYKHLSTKFVSTLIAAIIVFLVGAGLIVQSIIEEKPPLDYPSASPVSTSSPVPSELTEDEESEEEAEETDLTPSPQAAASGTAGVSVLPQPSPFGSLSHSTPTNREKVRVKKVVDGDTVELTDGRKLRYIGIDTPETVKPNTPVQCMGKAASVRNKELVEGKEIEIEKDVSETDRYGRLLRYVYVGEIFVNQYLVAEGFAQASSYPPDVKYQEILRAAQRAAQESEKGLWKSCEVLGDFTIGSASPAVSLAAASPTHQSSVLVSVSPAVTQSPACVIKGNISTSGDKIFHLPGCGSYEKTSINEVQGERWFCNESDAVSAGWRKAKNC